MTESTSLLRLFSTSVRRRASSSSLSESEIILLVVASTRHAKWLAVTCDRSRNSVCITKGFPRTDQITTCTTQTHCRDYAMYCNYPTTMLRVHQDIQVSSNSIHKKVEERW